MPGRRLLRGRGRRPRRAARLVPRCVWRRCRRRARAPTSADRSPAVFQWVSWSSAAHVANGSAEMMVQRSFGVGKTGTLRLSRWTARSGSEQILHRRDLGLLVGLDLFGERYGVGVLAVGLLGAGHLDDPLVVLDHHLEEHLVERRTV